MSSNVGLTTPRGSGTSGYVQRNLSHLRPRDDNHRSAPYSLDSPKHRPRQPDPSILEHDRKRKIEVTVYELRDTLEEEGTLTEDEIDSRCVALRKELEEESQKMGKGKTDARGLKSFQVHDLAKAKIEGDERMRKALGIREDYEEGGHWRKQEERLREGVPEKNNSKKEGGWAEGRKGFDYD
ncbi:cwf21-domain-containing protein [Tothia fuscella]|uniref:Cwf21-domain-containing protein n=1 Tax=Tothia fuscella TaxID=1048955 RepID=A0A9P4NLS9_9PEZI|nr:cwf21-domain-containing protein [Tothia fuscella]